MPSLAERLATQYQQQTGRPADANDPEYATYVQMMLPRLIQADRDAYEASKGRWRVADRVATGATLGLMGAGIGSALMGGGAAAGSAGSASVPGAVGASAPPLGAGTVVGGAGGMGAGAGAAGAAGAGIASQAGRAAGDVAMGAAPGGMSTRDWIALATSLAGTAGGALSSRPNLTPNSQTTDPNMQKLIGTMQGRLDQSEPLYKSIMAMANGLLPTQYQNGGAGR